MVPNVKWAGPILRNILFDANAVTDRCLSLPQDPVTRGYTRGVERNAYGLLRYSDT